jgi:hypothetical protein
MKMALMQIQKSPLILLFFILSVATGFAQTYNQNTSPNNTTLPYPNPYDTNLNPSICDTLNYIFISITDSFKTIKGQQTRYIQNKDTNLAGRISYSRIPGSLNDNIITGSPFVFFCPYRYGKDSLKMYNVYTSLISAVGSCLLNGPVQNLSVYYTKASDNARIIHYSYLITEVKPGIDPRLKNATVTIEFKPDVSGLVTDNYTTYRVNIIIRP